MVDGLKPRAYQEMPPPPKEMPIAVFSPLFPPQAGWKLLWEQFCVEKGCLSQGIS